MKKTFKRILSGILSAILILPLFLAGGYQSFAKENHYSFPCFTINCEGGLSSHRGWIFDDTALFSDVFYNEDTHKLYINTGKELLISGKSEVVTDITIVLEDDADLEIWTSIRTNANRPAIYIPEGVTAHICLPYRLTFSSGEGPVILNDGTLFIETWATNPEGAVFLPGTGGEAIGGDGAVYILNQKLEVRGNDGHAAITGSYINIYNSNITAIGSDGAPAIGGTDSYVLIQNSSEVNATGGKNAAAIGSANGRNSGKIEIKNSKVTAYGGADAAAIGSGTGGSAGEICIEDSEVYAVGGNVDIGCGAGSGMTKKIVIDPSSSVLAPRMSTVPTDNEGRQLSLYEIENPEKAQVFVDGYPYSRVGTINEQKVGVYLPGEGHTVSIDKNALVFGGLIAEVPSGFPTEKLIYDEAKGALTVSTDIPVKLKNVYPDVPLHQSINIYGAAAHVILAGVNLETNGATFFIDTDAAENITLTVADGTVNRLVSTGNGCAVQKNWYYYAFEDKGGTLTIDGKGTLYAKGGDGCAAIGCGLLEKKQKNDGIKTQNIVIKDAVIYAEGGKGMPAIGGKEESKNVQILSGRVTAVGGEGSAAIAATRGEKSLVIGPNAILSLQAGKGAENVLGISYPHPQNESGEWVEGLKIENPDKKTVTVDNLPIEGSAECSEFLVFETLTDHCIEIGGEQTFCTWDASKGEFVSCIPQGEFDTGDFCVSGGVYGKDYSYTDGVLYIRSDDTPLTVANKDPGTPTGDRIVISAFHGATLTFDGVNIDSNSSPALEIYETCGKDVTVTLESGSVNYLTSSAAGCAGIRKNSGKNSACLILDGEGKLYAAGGKNAPGIGSDKGTTANIIIRDGTVEAVGGEGAPGIGSMASASYHISIEGGCVTALGSGAHDIGDSRNYNDEEILVCPSATVKADVFSCMPQYFVDGYYRDLALYIIDNPEGLPVKIDGDPLKYTAHESFEEIENKLYVYLQNGKHTVTVGEHSEDVDVSTDRGDFIVLGGSFYSATYKNGVLTIQSGEDMTIMNKNPDVPTSDVICIAEGVNARLTFAGVNISSSGNALTIAGEHSGKTVITLAQGTVNTLVSTTAFAVKKESESGTLVLRGNGSLSAKGKDRRNAIDGKGIVISDMPSVNTVFGTQPTNTMGEPLYLFTIDNSEGKEVYLNGTYNEASAHSPSDSHLYIYLPAYKIVTAGISQIRMSHQLTVGTNTFFAHYESGKWIDDGVFKLTLPENPIYTGVEQELVVSAEGLPEGYSVSYAFDRTDTFLESLPTTVNAGEYTVYYCISDGRSSLILPVSVTVSKATLAIYATDAEILYGDDLPVPDVRYEGFLADDGEESLDGTPVYESDYLPFDDTGEYEILPSGLTSQNYEIVTVPATLTVTKKELTKEEVYIGFENEPFDPDEFCYTPGTVSPRKGAGRLYMNFTRDGEAFSDRITSPGVYMVYVSTPGGENYLPTAQYGINTEMWLRVCSLDGKLSAQALYEAPDYADMNCDGKVTISDVTALLDYLSGSIDGVVPFDLGGNGGIDISDVTALLDLLAGK